MNDIQPTALFPRPVRPSSLHLAEMCQLAPRLATEYPTSQAATRFGSAVDRQVSAILSCLQIGDFDNLPSAEDTLPETTKLLEWLEENYPRAQWTYFIQERVELLDPETGELLTGGTPDLVCLHRTEPLFVVVDWKKAGQLWAGHLPPPDTNLQQLSYVAGYWLRFAKEGRKIEEAHIVLACWSEKGVIALPNKEPITDQRLWTVVDRVRKVPRIDLSAPRPEASVGEHCLHCYQRMHCHAHLLPLAVVTKAGLPEPFAEFVDQPITVETTIKALGWLEAADTVLREAKRIRDLVEGNIDAFVTQNGAVEVGALTYGPEQVKGKRLGATVETLTKMGLLQLIREGKTSLKCRWRKI
jgi:hypothetical protein